MSWSRTPSDTGDPEAIEKVVDLARLDELFEESRERPVWLFKHSLTCPVSGAAWSEYREFVAAAADGGAADAAAPDARFTVIVVQNARVVSNAVAERTGIRHESPQAILLAGGEPVWDASHWKINGESLAAAAGSDALGG